MLRREEELYGCALQGPDGTIGRMHDFYFDEETWQVRYMLVKTADWPIQREVFVAPAVLESCSWDKRSYSAALTKNQVINSPAIKSASVLPRAEFAKLDQYYGWARWAPLRSTTLDLKPGRALLHSTRALLGFAVELGGTEIGPVEDMLIDDSDWQIRYLAVTTREWSRGQRRLVRREWIDKVSRSERTIYAQVGPTPVAASRRHYQRFAH
jgi:hypothetical protein